MDECNFVNERENGRILTEAQLLRASLVAILSKEGRAPLKEMNETLNVRVNPKKSLFTE